MRVSVTVHSWPLSRRISLVNVTHNALVWPWWRTQIYLQWPVSDHTKCAQKAMKPAKLLSLWVLTYFPGFARLSENLAARFTRLAILPWNLWNWCNALGTTYFLFRFAHSTFFQSCPNTSTFRDSKMASNYAGNIIQRRPNKSTRAQYSFAEQS